MASSATEFRVDISVPAALIGDPARAAILMSLMDGGRRSAGELAAIANISPASTSGHLARLRDGGMVIGAAEGRRRFYRLAGPEVALAIEHLLALAPRTPEGTQKLALLRPLRWARTCYDHLAGVVGVALLDVLLASGRLEEQQGELRYDVTARGKRWFEREIGLDLGALRGRRRPLTRSCLDWTERRPHLAGALGAALLEVFRERRWLVALRPGRAMALTAAGERGLRALGLRIDPSGAASPPRIEAKR